MYVYLSTCRGASLRTAAHNIIVVPTDEFTRVGTVKAVKSLVQAVPSSLLQPLIGSTEAAAKVGREGDREISR